MSVSTLWYGHVQHCFSTAHVRPSPLPGHFSRKLQPKFATPGSWQSLLVFLGQRKSSSSTPRTTRGIHHLSGTVSSKDFLIRDSLYDACSALPHQAHSLPFTRPLPRSCYYVYYARASRPPASLEPHITQSLIHSALSPSVPQPSRGSIKPQASRFDNRMLTSRTDHYKKHAACYQLPPFLCSTRHCAV